MDKIQINWESIWDKFNDWYEDSDDPSWDNQKQRIQYLIDEYLLIEYGL